VSEGSREPVLGPDGFPVEDRPRPPAPAEPGFWARRLTSRREKIAAEIRRNHEGSHRVPTWVLAVILLVIIAAYAALIIFT
jgi:hypothetical protein